MPICGDTKITDDIQHKPGQRVIDINIRKNCSLTEFFLLSVVFISAGTATASSLPTIIISPDWQDVDLQLSPSTVDMFSGQQLDTSGVQNTQELQTITPGMVFTSSTGVGQAYLRGIGGTVSAAGSSRVATFIDGVYLPRAVQSMQEFFDIKRVEVIKGPHAVHLGRNVVGGAVSIITQEPQPYNEGYVDVLYGTDNQRQLRGAVNVVIDENFSFRVAGLLAKRDGYSQNTFLDKDLDDQDYYAWRGKLRYKPSDKLDVIFSVEQNQQDDTRGAAQQPDTDVGVNGGIALGGVVPDDPREVTHNVDQNQNNSSDLYNAKVVWRSGGVELQSITAYQNTKQDHAIDLDATDVDFSSSFPESEVDTYSQEFRLSSVRGGALSWLTGLFLSKYDAFQQADIRFPLMAVESISASTTNNSSSAIFGELNYLFTPRWQGRIGVRYNYDVAEIDQKQTINDPFGAIGPAGVNSINLQDEQRWAVVTPEFGLSFNGDDDTFYYGKISRGYNAGGYNTYAVQSPYDPEFLWAYELGIKKDIPDQSLRINASLFYYDYTDMQLITLPPNAPPGTLPIITNAAKSVVRGVDLQIWYQPITDLEFTAGATILDAYFKEFFSIDPNNPLDDPDRSGEPLPMAPDLSLVLGASYQLPQIRQGDLKLSVNYKYQSAVYFNPYQDEAVRQDDYGLLNASISYFSYSSNWYAELYGNNLTDELYAQNIIRVDPVLGTSQYWGEPRTFGFRLGYNF